ncbi:serine-rich and transmembrane domain-containing 2 [Carettochelys insculpta]|uniref:serine-rich and transmembrane domain-containing 2 n=1 Tax=Carettochelys insculpta TaxID=44489 RepID=UPI003EBA2A76
MTDYVKHRGNITGRVYLPTLATEAATTEDKYANLYLYVGLFMTFLAVILVLLFTMLFRLKHVITPITTSPESTQTVQEFTNVEMIGRAPSTH